MDQETCAFRIALPCFSSQFWIYVGLTFADLQYNALSFIFLQVRELSWLQWHPFSVSSSPFDGKNHLSILIKVLGGWTAKLNRNIMNISGTCGQNEVAFQCPNIKAWVEGPYGHRLPYHLMYAREISAVVCKCFESYQMTEQYFVDLSVFPANHSCLFFYCRYEKLVLVAGGIGISPFLAILSDILHRVREGKPCLPSNVLLVWAIKKSDELPLLSTLDMESISPYSPSKLDLEIDIYITRESEPPLVSAAFNLD